MLDNIKNKLTSYLPFRHLEACKAQHESLCTSLRLFGTLQRTFFLTLIFTLFLGFAPAMAANSGSCSGPQSCGDTKCNAFTEETSKNKILNFTSSSNTVDGACVKKATQSGCFNSNPTGSSGSYFGLGYRPNGAGGNPKPRNHLGADIGGGGKTDINVYAAADGEVVYTNTSKGGGRTIVIEHERKCTGNPGKYKTIYRHLFRIQVAKGQHVTKDSVIGVEGGSNAPSQGAKACDNGAQRSKGTDGYGGANCSSTHSYAIHLHFEVVNSPLHGSSYIGDELNNVLFPNCGGLQVLCGGCAADTSGCKGFGATSDGSSANMEGMGGTEGDEAYGDSCEFGAYLDSQGCTFCELFKKLFNAASIMAKTANDGLAIPTKNVVTIAFLIWIAVYILKQVTMYSQVSTGEMIKGILFQGFRVAVVILALNGAIYQLMDLTLNPVIQSGLAFGNLINSGTSGTCEDSAPYLQDIVGYDAKTGFPKGGASSEAKGGLSKDVGKAILCSLKSMEDSTAFLMNLGKYSMCIAWDRHPWPRWTNGPLPHFGYLSTGVVLWLVGLMLLIAFPWCLVDCILQFCIAVALIPCAVGAYAFKITAQYLKTIWNMFMNAMFNFVFMAIIIYIINKHLMEWIGYTPGTNPDEKIFVSAFSSKGLAWWGLNAFKVFGICMFCWCFFEEAGAMAKEFANGMPLHNIGGKVGGTVTSAARKGLSAAGGAAASVAVSAGKGIGQAVNSAVGNQFRSGLNHARGWALGHMGGKEGVNADGEKYVEKTFNILGFKHTRRVTQGADGIYRQDKETHERSNYEKYFTVKTDKDGNQEVYAKKTFMGMTMFGMFGKEKLTARDDNGRTIWEQKGKDRKLEFDENGEAHSFHLKHGTDRAVINHGGTRTTNDAFLQTRDLTNSKGETIGRTFDFRNVTSNHLENKDGTINMTAINQMVNGAQDKKLAYEGVMVMLAEKRGLRLDNQFKDRKVIINDDKSVSIIQKNNDGTTTQMNAKMMGDQMVMEATTISNREFTVKDEQGNDVVKTESYISGYVKDNGMRRETETYTYNNKTGQYDAVVKHDINQYWKNRNNRLGALNADGKWGTDIDREKVMKGFIKEDYDEHIKTLGLPKDDDGRRQTTLNAANSPQFKDMSQADIMARLAKRGIVAQPPKPVQQPTTPPPTGPNRADRHSNPSQYNQKPDQPKQHKTLDDVRNERQRAEELKRQARNNPENHGKVVEAVRTETKIDDFGTVINTGYSKDGIVISVQKTDADQTVKYHTYFADGKNHTSGVVRTNGEAIHNTYDADGRIIEKREELNGTLKTRTAYQYDKDGAVSSQTFDAQGNPIERPQTETPEQSTREQQEAELAQLQQEVAQLQNQLDEQKAEQQQEAQSEQNRIDDTNTEAAAGNDERDVLNAQINEINAQISAFNDQLKETKEMMLRTDLTPEQQLAVQKQYEELSTQLESFNAQIQQKITETQSLINDWQNRREVHNRHVDDHENVK